MKAVALSVLGLLVAAAVVLAGRDDHDDQVIRRTPLPRSSPETLRAWERRSRRPLPAMSAKAKSRLPARQVAVEVATSRDRGCVARDLVPTVTCAGRLEGDERKPRSAGGDPTNPDHVQMLCAAHHRWKTTHAADAAKLGLREWSWQ